jgi:peptidyl-prolyl cis-trans isomerase A (cyclophilin A)
MKVIMLIALIAILLSPLTAGEKVTCRIETAAGDIQIEVYPDKAPLTAGNFLHYVDVGLYDGTTFFRVLTPANQPDNEFKIEVIQGGDVAAEKCFPPIAHETTKTTGLAHQNGTISMARAEPGTASCSFFICVNDQPELDCGGRRNPDGQGFAAFGRVVSGMEVVKKIQLMEQDKQFLTKSVQISSIRRQISGK